MNPTKPLLLTLILFILSVGIVWGDSLILKERVFNDNVQIIETDNINFEIPITASHYWKSADKDLYEIIVYNLEIKGFVNKTLKITWEDDRYIEEKIKINYTIKDGILREKDIKPYSVSKNSKLTFSNLKIETGELTGTKIKEIIKNETDKFSNEISIIEEIYNWYDFKFINLTEIDASAKDLSYTEIDDIEIDVCGILSDGNKTYFLNSSIASEGTCFTISANNITLDCQGHQINYSSLGENYKYGIYSNQNYTTVRNCIVYDNNRTTTNIDRSGIYFQNANFGNIINNTVNVTQRRGIYLSTSSNNNSLTNNAGTAGTYGGIYLYTSSNNNLINNTGTAGTYGGIYLSTSSNNNSLTNNAGNSLINDIPIRLYNSTENSLYSNYATYLKIESNDINYAYGYLNYINFSNNAVAYFKDDNVNITVGNNTIRIRNMPTAYNVIFNGTSTTPQCENVNTCNLTDLTNRGFVFSRPEEDNPYPTSIATTITSYDMAYVEGTSLTIDCSGTGSHSVTNLLDLSGYLGKWQVYHDGALIGTYDGNDLTVSSCSEWSIIPLREGSTLPILGQGERTLLFLIPILMGVGALYMLMNGNLGLMSILIFLGLTVAIMIIRTIF